MRTIYLIIIVALVRYATDRIGLLLPVGHLLSSPIWPSTGVSLGLVMIFGRRSLPGVFIGAWAGNFSTLAEWTISLPIAAGNTLEIAVAYHLTCNRFKLTLSNIYTGQRTLYSAVSMFIVPAAVSASFGVITLYVNDQITSMNMLNVWLIWWSGNVAGFIIMLPLVVALHRKLYRACNWKDVLALTINLLVAIYVFFNTEAAPVAFVAAAMIVMIAQTFNLFTFTVSMITMTIIAIIGTTAMLGPFADETIGTLQFFLIFVGIAAAIINVTSYELVRARDVYKNIEALKRELNGDA